MDEERPKLEALFTRTASAKSFTLTTESTGPKISSTAMRASGFTPANTVGRKKCPFASAPSVAGSPPATSVAPASRPIET